MIFMLGWKDQAGYSSGLKCQNNNEINQKGPYPKSTSKLIMIFWVFYELNNALEIFTDGGKHVKRHASQSTLKICMCLMAEFTRYFNQVSEKDRQLRSFIYFLLIMIRHLDMQPHYYFQLSVVMAGLSRLRNLIV